MSRTQMFSRMSAGVTAVEISLSSWSYISASSPSNSGGGPNSGEYSARSGSDFSGRLGSVLFMNGLEFIRLCMSPRVFWGSVTSRFWNNLKSSTHYPQAVEVYSNSLRQEFVFSHLRWPQTQAMYDEKCWSARFPDFSPVSKLEI